MLGKLLDFSQGPLANFVWASEIPKWLRAVVTAVSTAVTVAAGFLTGKWGFVPLLLLLLLLDLYTAYRACESRDQEWRSRAFREGFVYKIRDYGLVFVTLAVIEVAFARNFDLTFTRYTFLTFVFAAEAMSVLENAVDAGMLPERAARAFIRMMNLKGPKEVPIRRQGDGDRHHVDPSVAEDEAVEEAYSEVSPNSPDEASAQPSD